MTDPTPRIRRLSQLPQQIAPPRDGWPALGARLREHGTPREPADAAPMPTHPCRDGGYGPSVHSQRCSLQCSPASFWSAR